METNHHVVGVLDIGWCFTSTGDGLSRKMDGYKSYEQEVAVYRRSGSIIPFFKETNIHHDGCWYDYEVPDVVVVGATYYY